jgi:hypothetical protein
MLAGVLAAIMVGLGIGTWQFRTNLSLKASLEIREEANRVPQMSLDERKVQLDRGRIGLLAELSAATELRGNVIDAMRIAALAGRLELAPAQRGFPSLSGGDALAAVVSQSGWHFNLVGHQGPVRSATFSPDGSRIVTASDDSTARIWDAASGKEIAVLRGHKGRLQSAAFSLDGSRIITASDDSTAGIWDAESGKEITVLREEEHMRFRVSAAFSPSGARAITVSGDGANIWDAASGKEIAVLRHGSMTSAVFSPDGSRIVTTSSDATARIWDAESGAEITALRGHEGVVEFAAFRFDGSRIFTTSNNTARVWDAEGGKEITVDPVLAPPSLVRGARDSSPFRGTTSRASGILRAGVKSLSCTDTRTL